MTVDACVQRPLSQIVATHALACLLLALLAVPGSSSVAGAEGDASSPELESAICGSLQELIDATPTGSILTVPPCTYREEVVIDRPMTVVGDGATISGQDESGNTVRDRWITVTASDVTVSGFTMRDADNDPQTGAVQVEPGVSRFTLLDCDLAGAAGANVSIGVANDSRVEGCDIHHAGQIGVHIGGDGSNGAGNVIANNIIRDNNTAGFDPEWEAGGLKATQQTGLRLVGNTVMDNGGPGLWCDIYCQDIEVSDNVVHDNTHAGIMFEVSTGASILDNRIWGNGWGKSGDGWGAGILVSSSGGAQVIDNVVAWNNAGISVISQDRQDWDHSARDNEVSDNIVVGEAGRPLVIWRQDWDGILHDPESDNRGSGDAVWSDGGRQDAVFQWGESKTDYRDFSETPAGADSTWLKEQDVRPMLEAAGVWCCPSAVDSE